MFNKNQGENMKLNKFDIRLKELRLKNNLTQEDIAKIVGVTQSCVAKWEKGINEPEIMTAIALSKYFKVSMDYILGVTDH